MDKLPMIEFQTRLVRYTDELNRLKKQIRTTSILRLSVFFVTVVGIYLSTSFGLLPVILVGVVGSSSFIYLIRKHQKQEFEKALCQAYVQINQEEINLLNKQTQGMATGENYLPENHPYAADLDLFGHRSLFQLINRSALESGKTNVAQRLLTPILNEKQLIERQEAIHELSKDLSWRQHFQAAGLLSHFLSNEKPEDQNDLPDLLQWVAQSGKTYDTLINRLFVIIIPLLGFGVVFSIIMHWFPPVMLLVFLIFPTIILGPKLGDVGRLHALLTQKNNLLKKYARLFTLVEKKHFETSLNLKNKHIIMTEGGEAGKQIKHLSDITSAFDYRLNMIMGVVLNAFFLWDILQAIRLERWKNKNSEFVSQWFKALSTIDELNSFAGYTYGNPEGIFPEISSKDFQVMGEGLKHPLILAEKCVGNPIAYTNWKQFQVITGANMAGKSTYLRTIGVNMVMAMSGATVLASYFRFKPVQLFTGIKTTDSIQDGESYFFAELKRLQELIDRLKSGQSLFIILDEILRGTNSADKQKGSKALITQLISYQSSGMIATHDLTLGELAQKFPDHVVNKRFEVEIRDDNLAFDYLLKEGISENLNASFLMKKMGITL